VWVCPPAQAARSRNPARETYSDWSFWLERRV
jgi:hypothetical protein